MCRHCMYSDQKINYMYVMLQSDGRVRTEQKTLLNGPYTLIHILVVALLAFFLGHFL